jgi:hypothetical protein
MILRIRRFDEKCYEMSVFTDGRACILSKQVDEAEFKRVFEYYSTLEFDMTPIDDKGCSDELYEITISNDAIA